MITVLNRSYPTARKEHKCMYCGGTIKVGEKYERQTNKYDNQIYDWVCHLECQKATGLLNMFDNDMGEGIGGEQFVEYLQEWLCDKHYNDETDTYDEGFDPDKLSYHDIVLNIIKELKGKEVMTITTKHNIGDDVWFLFDGKPLNGKIARISEYTIKVKIIFKDGKEYLFSRDIKDFKLFPTKEELLKSL